MKQRCGLYARVSTFNGQDPEMQLRELRQFAAARGWEIVEEFVDQGISGSKDRRPALDRLMAAARSRKIDIIAVWKLDRFARSLKHLVNALAEFESLGIAFVSLKDNVDLTTASGRLMFQIIGAMAEFERSLIQERVRAGLRNAVAKGKRLGRPQVPLAEASRQTIWRRQRAILSSRMAQGDLGVLQGHPRPQMSS
jgi:DNA invertase Pin-like site-specific DNA recombinase